MAAERDAQDECCYESYDRPGSGLMMVRYIPWVLAFGDLKLAGWGLAKVILNYQDRRSIINNYYSYVFPT